MNFDDFSPVDVLSETSRILVIEKLLLFTATSLGKSFARYWPADDRNHPVERNVSLHFSHALLNANFSVFAEADHPQRDKIRGIDILGVSASNTWFIACEFKRLYSSQNLISMSLDIDRLLSFWIRTKFSQPMYGDELTRKANLCTTGYGMVGGLHWIPGHNDSSKILNVWNGSSSHKGAYSEVAGKLAGLKAVLLEPTLVHTFPTGNRYYLLNAICELPKRGICT